VSQTGYITEIPYPIVYHRELNPAFHALTLRRRGYRPPAPGFSYLELGCAWGLSTLVHAASHPDCHFVGIDFNSQCVAAAREIAAAAGLTNVEFVDAEFGALIDRPGDFDVIAGHGVWSWVSEQARREIIALAKHHLKPNGLLYLSYNALPGNGPVDALRRLMQLGAAQAKGPLNTQIEAGIAMAAAVKAANAAFFKVQPMMGERLEYMIKPAARDYLAHEYFNADWWAFYHADVAAALKPAGLEFAVSAHVLDLVDDGQMSQQARHQIASAKDSATREMLRDFVVNCLFRRDLFMRGLVEEETDALAETRFLAGQSIDRFQQLVSHTMLGELRPPPESGRAVLSALASGPASAEELEQHPMCKRYSREQILHVLLFLTGLGGAEPILDDDGLEARKAATQRLNRVLVERALAGAPIDVLASPVSGGGISVNPHFQAFLAAAWKGDDPVRTALALAKSGGEAEARRAYEAYQGQPAKLYAALGLI
jgi:SAM-dependent methyltransferase